MVGELYTFEYEIIPNKLREEKVIFLDNVEQGAEQLQKYFKELMDEFDEANQYSSDFEKPILLESDFFAKMCVVNDFNILLIMKMPEPKEIRDCFYVAFNIDHNYSIRYFTLEKGVNGKVLGEWDLDEDEHTYLGSHDYSLGEFISKVSEIVTRKLEPFKGYATHP